MNYSMLQAFHCSSLFGLCTLVLGSANRVAAVRCVEFEFSLSQGRLKACFISASQLQDLLVASPVLALSG